MPDHVERAVYQGRKQWNDCQTQPWPEWPTFWRTTNPSTADITITYVGGTSTGGCGSFNLGTNALEIYDYYAPSPGVTVYCSPSEAAIADTVAHEFGHYLGLDESLCSGHIMGPLLTDAQGNLSTTPAISTAEKIAVDEINQNDEEYIQEECGGSQNCEDQSGQSPILLDLDGGSFQLSGLDDPVWFDIDGDWRPELTGWTARGSLDGFLFMNRYKGPTVDDGTELFGDSFRSLLTGETSTNGYEPLAEMDSPLLSGNGNGRIDAGDVFFHALQVWIDANHDGISAPEECFTLGELGIVSLDLTAQRIGRRDRHGNEIRFQSRALLDSPPRTIQTGDVFFVQIDN